MGASADRKAARLDVIARLAADATVTAIVPAARIFDSRTTALAASLMPAINVFVPRTQARQQGAKIIQRLRHTIVVECFATGATDAALAASVDDLADAVEEALLTDPVFMATFEEVATADVEIALDTTGDERKGLARIAFDVTYAIQYNPAMPDDLSSVDIDVDFIEDGDAPDGDIDADLLVEDLET